MNYSSDHLPERTAPTDELFEILTEKRHRYVLYCLEKFQSPLSLSDLAEEVARLEQDVQLLSQIQEEDITGLYVDLSETHIPKLVDSDLVTYDSDSDAVSLKHRLAGLDLKQLI